MRLDNFARDRNKKPRYVVRVAFDQANTDFVYFTSHPDTELPDSVTSITDVIRHISGTSQKIDPDKGLSTIGSFSFQLIDKTNAVTIKLRDKLIAGSGLRYKRVVVYKGLKGDAWADYETVISPIIDGVTYKDGIYDFKCSDINRLVRKDIFDPEKTYLSKTVTSTQTHIPCLATSLALFPAVWHDTSYTDHPSASVSYIRLEDEVICHSGLFTHDSDGVSFQVVERGALNTKAAEHVYESGKATDRQLKITEHIFIEGAAPKVAYQLLTGLVAQNLCTNSEDMSGYGLSALTYSANNTVAPDGTTTADRLTSTGAADCYIYAVPINGITAIGGRTFTFSFWVKGGVFTSSVLRVYIIDTSYGDIHYDDFVLTNQWQRISLTATFAAGEADTTFQVRIDFGNDITVPINEYFWTWGWQVSETNNVIPYYKTTATARSALTLTDNWHLGVDHSFIRLQDLTAYSDLWNQFDDTGQHVRFEGHKKTDGKRFIEQQLMFWLASFMPIYSDGQLGFKKASSILADSSYVTVLNADNIVSYSDLTHDYKSVINQITVDWNFIYSKEGYTKTSVLVDLDSVSVHDEGTDKNIELRGVHTASHTDEDILSYFDSMRDRYSGPPLRLTLTVLPSMAGIEVGDVVKVELDQIRDFTTASGTTLSRAFEVQQVNTDWITGNVVLTLFGSSQKAGTLARTALSAVLDDAFYNSAGTELSTVLTIAGGAVTASGSLTGGTTMNQGVYYYLGNLTINPGVTITISNNVQLRIRGHLTINGTIDGAGNGLSGGAGATLWSNGTTTYDTTAYGAYPKHNANTRVAGYLGDTKSAADIVIDQRNSGGIFSSALSFPDTVVGSFAYSSVGNLTKGAASSMPYYTLKNNDTALLGIASDMRGTAGGGGGCVYTRQWSSVYTNGSLFTIRATGGTGGDSGAGLSVISRGASFGVAGQIDLSGTDGAIGTSYTSSRTYNAGSGGGGAPGGFALFLDGNHTPPDLLDYLTQNYGNSPIVGTPISAYGGAYGAYITNNMYTGLVGYSAFDMGRSAYTMQYIPEYVVPTEETIPVPPNVANFNSVGDGLYALLTWDAIIYSRPVKYRVKSGTTWDSGTFIADTYTNEIGVLMSTITTYNFMIKAVDEETGQESATVAMDSLSGVPKISLDADLNGTDDYESSTFYYRNTFESVDGYDIGNASLSTTAGSLVLSAVAAATAKAIKYNSSTLPSLSFSNQWRFKSFFSVSSGTGQYISSSGATGATIGVATTAIRFNIILKWNSGTSRIDIYLETRSSGINYTQTLITSITDTGVLIKVAVVFTPGVNCVAIVTISGVDYTATNTTNLPSGTVTRPMEIGYVAITGTCVINVYDYVCVQI